MCCNARRKIQAEGELAEAKAILTDAPDHSDIDALVFDNNRLQAALAQAQERGDGYKSESETSFARARRAEQQLARAPSPEVVEQEVLERACETIRAALAKLEEK